MRLFKTKLEKIFAKMIRDRNKELSDKLDIVVFLDFDGVLNLELLDNYGDKPFDHRCINALNRLCHDTGAKIVVISSWRKYNDYKERLYISGLDRNIEIAGKTEYLHGNREEEVLDYLEKHPYIGKFVVIDDEDFDLLDLYHVKTVYSEGFQGSKLKVAKLILEKQKEIK